MNLLQWLKFWFFVQHAVFKKELTLVLENIIMIIFVKMIIMKQFFLFCFLSFILFSCKKTEVTNEPFEFISLSCADSVPLVNTLTTITAEAKGTELTYRWSFEPVGTIVGSGHQVQYTICHATKVYITCDVSNSENKTLSKTIEINVK